MGEDILTAGAVYEADTGLYSHCSDDAGGAAFKGLRQQLRLHKTLGCASGAALYDRLYPELSVGEQQTGAGYTI